MGGPGKNRGTIPMNVISRYNMVGLRAIGSILIIPSEYRSTSYPDRSSRSSISRCRVSCIVLVLVERAFFSLVVVAAAVFGTFDASVHRGRLFYPSPSQRISYLSCGS